MTVGTAVQLLYDSQGSGMGHHRGEQALVMVETPSVRTDSGGGIGHWLFY